MHINVLDFIFCLLRGVGLGAEKCRARKRSGSALSASLRLWQSCGLLHGVEERENDVLIPSDKHPRCELMRRADGFSWVGPIRLGEQREGRLQREVLSGWLS